MTEWILRPPRPEEDPGGTDRPVVSIGPTIAAWTRVVRADVTDEMVERAVSAFWAQDLYEHTHEETVAAMRDALVAALVTKHPSEETS